MRELNDDLKRAINILQFHIDRNSKEVLLIFDSVEQQMRYIKSLKNVVTNERGITLNQLYLPSTLDGLRYRAFYFMTDDDLIEKEV